MSTNKQAAEAELWVVGSDSPRPERPRTSRAGGSCPTISGPSPSCPDGWPGTPSATDICLKGGFHNDRNYHLIYRATDSPVMGLGYVTSRDFVSFLRFAGEGRRRQSESGGGHQHHPVPGHLLERHVLPRLPVLRLQRGRAGTARLRRHAHSRAGAQRLFLNYRFAQPNPFTQQHRERYVPDVNFPVTYAITRDPAHVAAKTAFSSGRRPIPKIIHTDTCNEYWQFRASLLGTDPDGTSDIADPPNVRRYLLAGTQHGWFKGDAPHHGIANRQCEQLDQSDPHRRDPARADRRPGRLGQDTAHRRPTAACRASPTARWWRPSSLRWPAIPGVTLRRAVQRIGRTRFRAAGERQRRRDRQAVPGYPEHPSSSWCRRWTRSATTSPACATRSSRCPVATLTGWNTRTAEFGGDDLCDLLGSTHRAATNGRGGEERPATPRPALDELYKDHAGLRPQN